MILFRENARPAILSGTKTVTRRRGKRRWRVGAERLCYNRPPFCRYPGEPFARVRIMRVDQEAYPGQTNCMNLIEEAQREGFAFWGEFRRTYIELHGERAMMEPCWRVEFELVEAL